MTLRVALVSDPELPDRYSQNFLDSLQKDLSRTLDKDVEVYHHTKTLRLQPDGSLALGQSAELARSEESTDLIFVITEVPRFEAGAALVAELHADDHAAVISYPSLGPVRPSNRFHKILVSAAAMRFGRAEHGNPLRWAKWLRPESDEGTYRLAAKNHQAANVRMAAGMAMSNDPLRALLNLSSALAAASAAGGFGIFYNSIWQMANALSTPRLALIAVLAVVVVVSWLLVSNRLWESGRLPGPRSVMSMYNTSTLITLTLAVIGLYVLLLVLVLAGALVVIDPSFMSTILGHPVSFKNYLDIAWLSADMGLVAGALGASFDNDLDVRRFTSGQRERQRYLEENI